MFDKTNYVLLLDIDGVIAHKKGNTSLPNIELKAIKRLVELEKKGFKIALITARSPEELRQSNLFPYLKRYGSNIKVYASKGVSRLMQAESFIFDKRTGNILKDEKGNALTEKKLISRTVLFGETEKFLSSRLKIGKIIEMELKRSGFKIADLTIPEILQDPSMVFYSTGKNINSLVSAAEKIVEELYKNKQSPVRLKVINIGKGVVIAPIDFGKHFGAKRALYPFKDKKTMVYAFGDNKSDLEMKINSKIKFIKVNSVEEFLKRTKNLLSEFNSRKWKKFLVPFKRKLGPKNRKKLKLTIRKK